MKVKNWGNMGEEDTDHHPNLTDCFLSMPHFTKKSSKSLYNFFLDILHTDRLTNHYDENITSSTAGGGG